MMGVVSICLVFGGWCIICGLRATAQPLWMYLRQNPSSQGLVIYLDSVFTIDLAVKTAYSLAIDCVDPSFFLKQAVSSINFL